MGRRARPSKAKPAAGGGDDTNGEPRTELLPPPVDDKVIDDVVRRLNDLVRLRGIELAVEMGRLVVDSFFGGDLDAYHSRGARDASLRKLAKHPKLGVSASTVHRAIETYAVQERMGNPDWKNLGVTHIRAVLALADSDQERLLTQAEEKGWTAERVESEASKARKKIADGRGRKPLLRFDKSIRHLGKFFADPDDSFGDTERIDELEDEQALSLFKTVSDAKAKLDELQKLLQKRVKGLGT